MRISQDLSGIADCERCSFSAAFSVVESLEGSDGYAELGELG